jgi:hypothetical protein
MSWSLFNPDYRHLFPTLPSVIKLMVDVNHGGRVYTMNSGKCYRAEPYCYPQKQLPSTSPGKEVLSFKNFSKKIGGTDEKKRGQDRTSRNHGTP